MDFEYYNDRFEADWALDFCIFVKNINKSLRPDPRGSRAEAAEVEGKVVFASTERKDEHEFNPGFLLRPFHG